MSTTDTVSSYQPYVEDYDSVISEVVPLTRRHTTSRKSGLSNEVNLNDSYDGVSDSGYSSTNTPTPNNETPPLKSRTPAPQTSPTPAPPSKRDSFKRASTPGITRPASKSFSRTASPAVPRNIPGAKPRERSPTMPTTGGADECDCADCRKDSSTGKGSPNSPSALSNGAWPVSGSYHGSYSQSPSWTNYPYGPPSRYDSYGTPTDSGMSDSSRTEKKRSSMPPPPRPSSTFSGASGSSYSGAYGSYFSHHNLPGTPEPPMPSSTCPPTAFSAYAPPPLNTNVAPSPGPSSSYSPYGPPLSIPSYGSSYDSWGRGTAPLTPSSSYTAAEYSSSLPPLPALMTASTSSGSSSSNRRNSMRAQANAGAYRDVEEYSPLSGPPQRRSSRVYSTDRPPSWIQQAYLEGIDRSVSVPPGGSAAHEPSRRKTTTPGPAPVRRRESSTSQSSSGQMSSRFGPSALARAMESCAIVDEPPTRSHSRSHSEYYSSHGPSHGQLARREHGALMQYTGSDSGSAKSGGSYQYGDDELVQMTVPDQDGETLTMRYPAGIPVKLQLNGGTSKTIAFGPREKSRNIECNVAYRYVQQRQQQVHAQLQHGALEHGSRKYSAGEYIRPSRRATMSGAGF